jgi:hypothetical protein
MVAAPCKEVKGVELDGARVKAGVKRLYKKFGFQTLNVINVDNGYENDALFMTKLN